MTKKPKPEKQKIKYVFPEKMAALMAKVDMRAQMEMGMMSQFLLLIGLSLMVIFILVTAMDSWIYKSLLIFNMVCGWLLITSYLITTYQQYVSYMEAMEIDPEAEKKRIKKKGSLMKRVVIAMKKRKLKKQSATPQLVLDALDNKEKIEREIVMSGDTT